MENSERNFFLLLFLKRLFLAIITYSGNIFPLLGSPLTKGALETLMYARFFFFYLCSIVINALDFRFEQKAIKKRGRLQLIEIQIFLQKMKKKKNKNSHFISKWLYWRFPICISFFFHIYFPLLALNNSHEQSHHLLIYLDLQLFLFLSFFFYFFQLYASIDNFYISVEFSSFSPFNWESL